MTSIKGTISEKLDEEFRKEVANRFGMRKGALSKALEEAIRQWVVNKDGSKASNRSSSYKTFKNFVTRKHPNKFIIAKDEAILAIADSVIEATQIARKEHPEITRFTLIHTVPRSNLRRQLGWRVRRVKK